MRRLIDTLASFGSSALEAIPAAAMLEAWSRTVEELADRHSAARRRLGRALSQSCGLSPTGLEAALTNVLEGASRKPAETLFADARPAEERRPAVIFLASNLPGLAVQPLLPALAVRRPAMLKSASAEPFFAPLFLETLCRHEPRLRPAVAALTWTGGDHALEAPLLSGAGRVIAYGDDATMADLEQRAPDKLIAHGHRLSLAVVSREVDPARVAAGLARDIALFDQRGCLSIQAIYTDGDGERLGQALGEALRKASKNWPMGEVTPSAASAVQQLRLTAALEGLWSADLPLAAGTVIVDHRPELRPSPGLRTVRLHPLTSLANLPKILTPWQGHLQGAALAGPAAWALEPQLIELGISRRAEPGHLQAADATWRNGGVSLLEALE